MYRTTKIGIIRYANRPTDKHMEYKIDNHKYFRNGRRFGKKTQSEDTEPSVNRQAHGRSIDFNEQDNNNNIEEEQFEVKNK